MAASGPALRVLPDSLSTLSAPLPGRSYYRQPARRATVLDNLAMACFHCNRSKGPNIAGLDPASGELVRLFHPRTDIWTDHFRLDGTRLFGLTPVGRVTIH